MSNADDKATRRTDWSEDRTIMANERTFASWMGTGLGCVGVAIGLQAIFGEFEPTWVAKAVASLFLVAAMMIFYSAQRQARKTLSRLHDNDVEPVSTRTFTLFASVLATAAFCVGVVLWLL